MMNRNDKAGCVRKGCWRLGGMNCVRQPGGVGGLPARKGRGASAEVRMQDGYAVNVK